MKSPLKPSIHFNCLNELNKLLNPKSKISSFFLHAAQAELFLSSRDHLVVAHTNRVPIFEFWKFLLNNPKKLALGVETILPILDDDQFAVFQETWYQNPKEYSRVVLYYILNMCSENGVVSLGKMDKEKLKPLHISRLNNFRINNFYPFFDDNSEDSLASLDTAKETDYVLFPVGDYSLNLFEKGKNKGPDMYTFNHKKIHARVEDLDKKCILLYKNHPALFNLYKSFNIKMVDKYGRVTDNKESSEDLIITNF